MQHGLSEVAADVDADPGAVFEAHGAESVQELLASGETRGEEGSTRVAALARLFSGLDRPERREVAAESVDSGDARESSPTPAVLGDLQRAIEAEDPDEAAEELEPLEDGAIADALAAADDLEEGEVRATVPEEWLEDA